MDTYKLGAPLLAFNGLGCLVQGPECPFLAIGCQGGQPGGHPFLGQMRRQVQEVLAGGPVAVDPPAAMTVGVHKAREDKASPGIDFIQPHLIDLTQALDDTPVNRDCQRGPSAFLVNQPIF